MTKRTPKDKERNAKLSQHAVKKVKALMPRVDPTKKVLLSEHKGIKYVSVWDGLRV